MPLPALPPEALAQLTQLANAFQSGQGGISNAIDVTPSTDENGVDMSLPNATSTPTATPVSYQPPSGYDTTVASIESGNNPDASNSNSSASGLYGFTDPTYQDTVAHHPELAGLGKNNPAVMDAHTGDNAKVLQNTLGRDPSPVDLYAAQFLGAMGATRFLSADPSTPVNQVVSPGAFSSNKAVFTNPDGSTKTVGQVYATFAPKFGFSPQMPSIGKDATPLAGGKAALPTAPAMNNPLSGYASLFPSMQSIYGPQQQALSDYIKSQPGMFDKLQQLSQQYLKQAQLSPMDKMSDAFNQFAQQSAAADASRYATAGGILLHALPNAQPDIQALQNSHNIQMQERQQRLGLAKDAFDMASKNLLAQNAQNAQNLALQGQLTGQEANYGMNTGRLGLEIAQFGQKNATALSTALRGLVPNPNTASAVWQRFMALGGNPSAPLGANLQLLNKAASDVQKTGLALDTPTQLYDVQHTDTGTGKLVHQTIDPATPDGAAFLAHLPSGYVATKLGTPSTTVNNSIGGEGKNAPQTPTDQLRALSQTQTLAQTALKILPFLKEAGGTGMITDSDASKDVQNVLAQLGINTKGASLRQLFGKIMTQLQVAEVLPSMKQMGGRGTGMEFQKIMQGQIGSTYSAPAIQAFLHGLLNQSQWEEGLLDAQNQARMTGTDEYMATKSYLKGHPMPGIPLPEMNGTTSPPAENMQPGAGKIITDPKTGLNWQLQNNGQWVQVK